MFDNLRDSGDQFFYEEEQNDLYKEQPTPAPQQQKAANVKPAPRARAKRRPSDSRFLGLSGLQRFILSLMLFFTVCIMGALAMFVLGKMGL